MLLLSKQPPDKQTGWLEAHNRVGTRVANPLGTTDVMEIGR